MLCPKGDDPVTVGQSNRQISISTGAKSGQLAGHFDFTFMGQAIGFDATATALSMKYVILSLSPMIYICSPCPLLKVCHGVYPLSR